MKKINKNNAFTILIFLFNCLCLQIRPAEKAVTIVPIADLVGYQLTNNSMTYNHLPLCGGTYQSDESCPRMHQLLFNEIVDVIGYHGNQAQIKIHNLYYYTNNHTKKQATYWTHKNNIWSLSALQNKSIDSDKFPAPISFESSTQKTPAQKIVTLYLPFYDPTTKNNYSAGTRFVQTSNSQTNQTLSVFIFDPQTNNFVTTSIPQELCISIEQTKPQKKIALFVKVLKKWAALSDGFIPYVWGGCSFTQRYNPEQFKQTITETGSFFYYRQTDNTIPKAGFDCSAIIARAAQIAGIPYFLKNSATIAQDLAPLTAKEQLQEGDIIWIPGHVMIVSNIKKNMLIEASSYLHGCGKIQEIPISTFFYGIKTYKQLISKHIHKQKVQRINTLTNIPESPLISIKLLKMDSIWQ